MWFTRSICTRSKITLTRCGELRGNPKQHCWQHNTWYNDLNGETAGCTATKKRLIDMFEKHQHEEQFLEDVSSKQEINRFSEESQKLLDDMNQTEIFELCENFAKHQCPDCNAFFRNWDHLLQLREKFEVLYNTPEDQLRLYFNPWLCHYEEFQSRPKLGASERQVMFYREKQMLQKARQSKHGSHPTILSRWYDQEDYRKSSAEHNIGEKEVMLFDRVAPERHDYTATTAGTVTERQTLDFFRLNVDGPQKPPRQRPEFAFES